MGQLVLKGFLLAASALFTTGARFLLPLLGFDGEAGDGVGGDDRPLVGREVAALEIGGEDERRRRVDFASGGEARLDAGEIILRADARMGELARELPKLPNDGSRNGSSPTCGPDKNTALADVGISRQRAAEFERVSKLPPAQLERYIAAERKAGRAPSTSSALLTLWAARRRRAAPRANQPARPGHAPRRGGHRRRRRARSARARARRRL